MAKKRLTAPRPDPIRPARAPSAFSRWVAWIREAPAWLACGLAAFLLAFPLVLREYRLEMEDLILPPAARQNLGRATTPLLALPLKANPRQADLSALHPTAGLLKELSAKRRQLPAFSASSADYEALIEQVARLHQVSPLLVKAVIQAESNFNPQAVSRRGAVGLMQVLPSTAKEMGVMDPLDPRKNITAGVKYLKYLLKQYNDDEKLAVAAYNCGPEALRRHDNRVPPFKETQTYVNRVMNYYQNHLDI